MCAVGCSFRHCTLAHEQGMSTELKGFLDPISSLLSVQGRLQGINKRISKFLLQKWSWLLTRGDLLQEVPNKSLYY